MSRSGEAPSREQLTRLLTDLCESYGEPGDEHLATALWLAGEEASESLQQASEAARVAEAATAGAKEHLGTSPGRTALLGLLAASATLPPPAASRPRLRAVPAAEPETRRQGPRAAEPPADTAPPRGQGRRETSRQIKSLLHAVHRLVAAALFAGDLPEEEPGPVRGRGR